MAFTAKQLALLMSVLGIASFIFGIIAENKKPGAGTPTEGNGVVTCNYPSHPTIVLGYVSFVFLIASSAVGYFSIFYPYKGKQVPRSVFFMNKHFISFFTIALFASGLGATLTLWPTIQEQYHMNNNVLPSTATKCETAKTGLLGGAAFVSLDSTLFWLVLLMLSVNVREDFLNDYSESNPITAHASSPIDIY